MKYRVKQRRMVELVESIDVDADSEEQALRVAGFLDGSEAAWDREEHEIEDLGTEVEQIA